MNVDFKNTSSETATVKLEKRGILGTWSQVDSFTVTTDEQKYNEMTGSAGKTYRVVISVQGAGVKGTIRVKQLDNN